MTEENYQYRTSQTMLRNQFAGEGVFQTPIIPKLDFTDEDFKDLLLIGFDHARADDEKNRDRMVHFFLYDYKFERVWKDAEKDLERLKKLSGSFIAGFQYVSGNESDDAALQYLPKPVVRSVLGGQRLACDSHCQLGKREYL